MKYECHATFAGQGEETEDAVQRVYRELKRDVVYASHLSKTRIDGDPALGPGARIYLTFNTASLENALAWCDQVQRYAEEFAGRLLQRVKIEAELLDRRF